MVDLCKRCNKQKRIHLFGLCRNCHRIEHGQIVICEDCGELKPIECKNRCLSCYKKYRHNKKPKILCGCGCGELICDITTDRKPARYKLGHNSLGENNPAWKGGRRICNDYIMIYRPNHPKSHKNIIYEHRWIYEQHYNCCLLEWTDIHHINGIKTDNRIENLQSMMKADHTRMNKPFLGRKHTETSRKKISNTLKQRNMNIKNE